MNLIVTEMMIFSPLLDFRLLHRSLEIRNECVRCVEFFYHPGFLHRGFLPVMTRCLSVFFPQFSYLGFSHKDELFPNYVFAFAATVLCFGSEHPLSEAGGALLWLSLELSTLPSSPPTQSRRPGMAA